MAAHGLSSSARPSRRGFLRTLGLGVAAVGLSAACAPAAAPSPTAAPAAKPTTAPVAAQPTQAPVQPSGAKSVFKIGHSGGATSTNGQNLRKFKQRAEELAAGALEVRIFDDSQLGAEKEVAQGLTIGTIEGGFMTDSMMSTFVPEFNLFSLPFIFKDPDHQARVLNGPLAGPMREKAGAKGFQVMALIPGPIRGVFHNWANFSGPDGFKGMKLRVIEAPIHVATWKATGAIATPMAWPEVYTSLQTKVLDGVDNAVVNLISTKVDEQIKVVMPTDHMITVMVLEASKAWFDRQPKNVQEALQQAATESVTYGLELEKKLQAEGLETLKQRGKVISQVDKEAFRKLMVQAVYPQFESVVGKENIKLIQDTP